MKRKVEKVEKWVIFLITYPDGGQFMKVNPKEMQPFDETQPASDPEVARVAQLIKETYTPIEVKFVALDEVVPNELRRRRKK